MVGNNGTEDTTAVIDTEAVSIENENGPAEADRKRLTDADIMHNMRTIIMLDAIFIMGFTDFALVMQPLLVYLNASNLIIGLVTGASFMGLVGIFTSPWISRRFVYKKWYMFIVHLPYIGALLLIASSIILSRYAGWSNSTLLGVVFVLTMLHWFFAGFVSLPHQEYVAACIPMSHRGRYTGWSYCIGGGLSIISAAIGGWILHTYPKPAAFGYVLLMAWAIAQGGYLLALFGRERPTPVEKVPNPWSKFMLKAFWNDKPYVGFMIINVLNYMLVGGVFGFVNIYGFKELGMVAATTAVIQILSQSVRLSTSGLAGILTDKLTAKKVYPYCYIVAALAFIPPLLIRNQYGIYLSVVVTTLFQVGISPASTALQYGLPSPENRTGHFTIQLLLFYTAAAAGNIFMGKMCDLMPYRTVFFITIFSSLGMFLLSKRLLSGMSDDANAYS